MEIKAIETKYKGYRFRSRTEARWAVFLDHMKEEWHYEVQGFDLPTRKYLPDFWLPRMGIWLEIKGIEPTEEEYDLCEELAIGSDKPVAIAWGLPFAAPIRHAYIRKTENWKAHRADYFDPERLEVFSGVEIDGHGSHGPMWDHGCFFSLDPDETLCISMTESQSVFSYTTPSFSSVIPSLLPTSKIFRAITQEDADVAKAARFEFQNAK